MSSAERAGTSLECLSSQSKSHFRKSGTRVQQTSGTYVLVRYRYGDPVLGDNQYPGFACYVRDIATFEAIPKLAPGHAKQRSSWK